MSGIAPGKPRTGVLFVCLGNICRSPLAKWVFEDLAKASNLQPHLDIDSCGTGDWHKGGPADHRSEAIARKYGLEASHIARQLSPLHDFDRFHYLIAMDRSNQKRMIEVGAPRERIRLLRSFDPLLVNVADAQREVPDPYYGEDDGFEEVYWMIRRACVGLIDEIRASHT